MAGQAEEGLLETAGGDLEVPSIGLGEEVAGDLVGVLAVDQHGVAADLHRLDAGQGTQGRGVGLRKRRPDGPPGCECLDRRARTVGNDPALADQHDPVSVLVGLFEVMGREQDRAAPRRIRPDRGPEGTPTLDVHAGGRLVEQEQRRVGQQRHRKAKALLLLAGALADLAVRNVGDPGVGQDGVDVLGVGEQARGVLDGLPAP